MGVDTGKKKSAEPACSRGSASEEKLPAARTARGKKVLQAARGKKQEARRRRCFRPLAAVRFETWRRAKEKNGFLSVQQATLGTTGSCPSSVLHCHGRCFRALAAVDFEACRRARGKGQLVLVGAESDVRHYRPLPGGPFRPSLPCCLSVAKALFSSLGS